MRLKFAKTSSSILINLLVIEIYTVYLYYVSYPVICCLNMLLSVVIFDVRTSCKSQMLSHTVSLSFTCVQR